MINLNNYCQRVFINPWRKHPIMPFSPGKEDKISQSQKASMLNYLLTLTTTIIVLEALLFQEHSHSKTWMFLLLPSMVWKTQSKIFQAVTRIRAKNVMQFWTNTQKYLQANNMIKNQIFKWKSNLKQMNVSGNANFANTPMFCKSKKNNFPKKTM